MEVVLMKIEHTFSPKLGSFNSSGGARCPAYGVRGHPPSTRQNRSKSGKLNSPISEIILLDNSAY